MIDGKHMLSLMSKRQSDRRYLDKPVEQEKLERILEAGRISPSACNGQPWKFIVVNDNEVREAVSQAASAKMLNMNTFVGQAPVLIVIIREGSNLSSKAGDLLKRKDYSHNDIGIATASLMYQATAEGLGTCIIGWFDEKKIKEILKVPRSKRIELILTVGYSDNHVRTKLRKPPPDIISYNRY